MLNIDTVRASTPGHTSGPQGFRISVWLTQLLVYHPRASSPLPAPHCQALEPRRPQQCLLGLAASRTPFGAAPVASIAQECAQHMAPCSTAVENGSHRIITNLVFGPEPTPPPGTGLGGGGDLRSSSSAGAGTGTPGQPPPLGPAQLTETQYFCIGSEPGSAGSDSEVPLGPTQKESLSLPVYHGSHLKRKARESAKAVADSKELGTFVVELNHRKSCKSRFENVPDPNSAKFIFPASSERLGNVSDGHHRSEASCGAVDPRPRKQATPAPSLVAQPPPATPPVPGPPRRDATGAAPAAAQSTPPQQLLLSPQQMQTSATACLRPRNCDAPARTRGEGEGTRYRVSRI